MCTSGPGRAPRPDRKQIGTRSEPDRKQIETRSEADRDQIGSRLEAAGVREAAERYFRMGGSGPSIATSPPRLKAALLIKPSSSHRCRTSVTAFHTGFLLTSVFSSRCFFRFLKQNELPERLPNHPSQVVFAVVRPRRAASNAVVYLPCPSTIFSPQNARPAHIARPAPSRVPPSRPLPPLR